MKKLIIISIIIFTSPLWRGFEMTISAQVDPVMVNYGTDIYMADDIIFANGGIGNFKDAVGGGSGTFRNSGSVYVANGNWTNSAGNSAFTDITGLANTNSTINFYMISAPNSTQNIQGSSVTGFYTLNLLAGGAKILNGVDAIVKDSLNLNDVELATGPNSLFVTNTDVGIITRSNGYISDSTGGALIRSTASTDPYLFPVGAFNRFRPVEIIPVNTSANQYSVGMINNKATDDGFPLAQKEANISAINSVYYHQIRRDAGSANASISIYYDQGEGFREMAHWQNQPQWEDVSADAPSIGKYGLNQGLTKQGWNFSSPFSAFALVKLANECGEMFVPNAFSPDNNGENDIEYVYGKCIQKIYFAIYDRWGEKVFETTDPKLGWDGSYKGKALNTAVFVYYLNATLTTGELVTKKGNISLFR